MSDIMILKQKVCSKCGREKAVSEFGNSSFTNDGKKRHCKLCNYKYYTNHKRICKIKNSYPIFYKTCSKCGEVKSVQEFYSNKKLKSGYNSSCNYCLYLSQSIRVKSRTCNIEIKFPIYFKACSKCGILQPVEEFHKSNMTKNELASSCKRCRKIYAVDRGHSDICLIPIKSKTYLKKCSSCGDLKFAHEYSESNSLNSGLQSKCKKCVAMKHKEKIWNNPDIDKCHISIKNKIYFKVCKDCGELKHIGKFYDTWNTCKICSSNNDYYIKKLIHDKSGIECNNITPELIGLQRTIVIAKRELREHNKKESNLTCISG